MDERRRRDDAEDRRAHRQHHAQREVAAGLELADAKTSDLESLDGNYDTVTCIDVMIHYPPDKMKEMVSHLAGLADKRLIISFAPDTWYYRALKKIGELAPGPSKTTRAYLHEEGTVRRQQERTLRSATRDFLDKPESSCAAFAFKYFMLFAILSAVTLMVLGSLPRYKEGRDYHTQYDEPFKAAELMFNIVFFIEFIVRCAVGEDRLRDVFLLVFACAARKSLPTVVLCMLGGGAFSELAASLNDHGVKLAPAAVWGNMHSVAATIEHNATLTYPEGEIDDDTTKQAINTLHRYRLTRAHKANDQKVEL